MAIFLQENTYSRAEYVLFSCRVCLLFVRRIKAISCSSFSPPLLVDEDLSLLGEGSRGRSTLHPLFFSSSSLPLAAKHPLISLRPIIAGPICCMPDDLIVGFVLAAVFMYGRGNIHYDVSFPGAIQDRGTATPLLLLFSSSHLRRIGRLLHCPCFFSVTAHIFLFSSPP